jgi:hypothetical protein
MHCSLNALDNIEESGNPTGQAFYATSTRVCIQKRRKATKARGGNKRELYAAGNLVAGLEEDTEEEERTKRRDTSRTKAGMRSRRCLGSRTYSFG